MHEKTRFAKVPMSFSRQCLSLHLLEVGLISANGVAGHIETRQLVADKVTPSPHRRADGIESVVPICAPRASI